MHLYEKNYEEGQLKILQRNNNFIFQRHEHFNSTKKLASYGVGLYLKLAALFV